ncbi:hemerythrin-like metal-binding protein [Rhodoferax saidenbachensis]|uniref:Hemerythrin-like metal-binding protein n=1 Tax=Rhodoferax saidenbachensis TaxID=1484693 RepID=A0ABU1ZR46_9BURK|nr:hemerythrin-like metal-binding protein [Rhodoferax saidenbachensis]
MTATETPTPFTPAPLQWSDALSLDMPLMDATHQEFVALLAEVVQAPDALLLPRWVTLIAHTQDHFDREDQWMRDTGFATDNCHTTQHKVVLQVMREGEARGHTGDLDVVRQMARELGAWFPQHAQSMDASLALHLRSAGYDLTKGAICA